MAPRLAMVLLSPLLLTLAGCLAGINGSDLEAAARVVPDPFGTNNDILDPTFWAEGSGGSLAAEGYFQAPVPFTVPGVSPREADQNGGNSNGDGDNDVQEPNQAGGGQGPGSHVDNVTDTACDGPPPNPAFANAWGTTVGLAAREGVLNVIDVSIDEAEIISEQNGPGDHHAADGLATQVIPGVGPFDNLATFRVAQADSHSQVSATPLRSNQTTRVELLNVSLLDGLVEADLVRAVASTNATPASAGYSSAGSVMEGLVVNGEPVEQVHPWLTIDLSERFGNGSRVSLFETMGHIHQPETPIDGFAGDMIVNMIHVWLRDPDGTEDPLDDPLEVIISHASSHSDYPQFPNCAPLRGVLAEAYDVHVSGAATGVPVTNGFVKIGLFGGDEKQHLESVDIADTHLSTLDSHATGNVDETRTWADATAHVQDVCILENANGCLVSAKAVEARAAAQAFPNLTTDDGTEVVIAELKIGATDVCNSLGLQSRCTPAPNTEIPVPGLGKLVLNEQLPLESDGPCHAIVGVRAIHFVPSVTLPHVIISEAQAGAFYC